jgi:acyl carrier protein
MEPDDPLRAEVKDLIVNNLMLPWAAPEIADDRPLFGPGGLGLDSVDALQLVVALDKHYGLKISDPAVGREVLASVSAIARAIARHRAQPAETAAPPTAL